MTTAVISINEVPWLVRKVVVMRSEPVRLEVVEVVLEVVVLLEIEVECEEVVEGVVEEVVDEVVRVTVAITVTGTVTTDIGTLSVDGSSGGGLVNEGLADVVDESMRTVLPELGESKKSSAT